MHKVCTPGPRDATETHEVHNTEPRRHTMSAEHDAFTEPMGTRARPRPRVREIEQVHLHGR